MNVTRDTLDILFRRLQPEVLIRAIDPTAKHAEANISSRKISKEVFQRYAYIGLEGFTPDEVENIHQYAEQRMKRGATQMTGPKQSVFYLLTEYAQDILTEWGGEPLCRAECLLGWRSLSFRLGQDIFTTAYLAMKDQRFGRRRGWFGWPAVLRSDDPRLKALMERGCAENHYHLNGSTRSLQISWVNLMNHPEQIDQYFQETRIQNHFRENLNSNLLLHSEDHQLPWNRRVRYACWFRVQLFRRISAPERSFDSKEWTKLWKQPFLLNRELKEAVGNARYQFGRQFPRSDRKNCCLDYALSYHLSDRHNDSFNRILTGERALLYECFYRCFSGEFTELEQDLFYTYLVLKSNFRGELIQVNQRIGLRNFLRYQDRKADFFDNAYEYWAEAFRLSVNGAISDGHITSLEARIMPAKTSEDTYRKMLNIDREVLFAQDTQSILKNNPVVENATGLLKHFYVLHFAKKKLTKEKQLPFTDLVRPRNSKVRADVRQQALALAQAFSTHDWICTRVRGIDACSGEVGCRPETFATEFRFLRGYVPPQREKRIWETREAFLPRLAASYHAGEDFLDLADGLRAVDEAVRFLELRRGDRLGHALALGVEPREYYDGKHNQIVLPKQDRLDDLVWLLFRSLELGVDMPSELRSNLTTKACQLMDEIYGDYFRLNGWHVNLQDYYLSWRRRGDHPCLYRSVVKPQTGSDPVAQMLRLRSLEQQYQMFYRSGNEKLECTLPQRGILHRYHYGKQEREKGCEITCITVTDQYACFIREMQEGLCRLIADCGIAVECNPSSNVLIGPFTRYEKHPIFRFNRYGLDKNPTACSELMVSVNTDDQGVFDTSLENEYALLAAALTSQRREDGTRIYGDDAIYCYLEHLQTLGQLQVFPAASDPIQGPSSSSGLLFSSG